MRKRKTVEGEIKGQPKSFYSAKRDMIKIELLLDIRQLLVELRDWALITEKPKEIKFEKDHPAVDCSVIPDPEKLLKLMDKVLGRKNCGVCHVKMKLVDQYKNESGAEFHTYQCPKCKGKIDYAQVKYDGKVGEFSVHSNIVPKEFVSAEDRKKRYEKGICDDVVDK